MRGVAPLVPLAPSFPSLPAAPLRLRAGVPHTPLVLGP